MPRSRHHLFVVLLVLHWHLGQTRMPLQHRHVVSSFRQPGVGELHRLANRIQALDRSLPEEDNLPVVPPSRDYSYFRWAKLYVIKSEAFSRAGLGWTR